jgi:hypothetical protein
MKYTIIEEPVFRLVSQFLIIIIIIIISSSSISIMEGKAERKHVFFKKTMCHKSKLIWWCSKA